MIEKNSCNSAGDVVLLVAPSCLPQVAENNTPQTQDAPGEFVS
jgi:hypothetical protein